ncbi:MAG TPA: ATP-binding protein [Puia sp.]|jgi:two-component system NarL family sensor kinase|nr:ATP-binding protein [Puia sp.]
MQKGSSEIAVTLIAVTITLLLLGFLMISFLYFYRKRSLGHAQEKEQLRQTYERELLKAQLEMQEQTFKNISQEIHDNIGQVLSLAKLNLSTADPAFPAALEQKIQDSRQLVIQAIRDLRNLSHGLNTDYIADLGLVKVVGHELEMIRRSGRYETQLTTEGGAYPLDKQVELIVFRIIQETLNNIVKHSSCQKIIIHLLYQPEKLLLSIRDDGKGFDLTPLSSNTSFGLGIKNMHNRARLIGAGFLISSTLEEGTCVTLTVPVVRTTYLT